MGQLTDKELRDLTERTERRASGRTWVMQLAMIVLLAVMAAIAVGMWLEKHPQ